MIIIQLQYIYFNEQCEIKIFYCIKVVSFREYQAFTSHRICITLFGNFYTVLWIPKNQKMKNITTN